MLDRFRYITEHVTITFANLQLIDIKNFVIT